MSRSEQLKPVLLILIIGILSAGTLYLFFGKELRAVIELAKIPFTEQRELPSDLKATEVQPWIKIGLEKIYTGFKEPVYLTNSDDNSQAVFIVEKRGRIITINNARRTVMLDVTDRVRSKEYERGLLSVTFHPDFGKNGRYFIYYTDVQGDVIISEFNALDTGKKEKVLLKVPQPYSNHNGGQLAFGPDGYLYIGTGDGGASGDPLNNGQNRMSLLGKILRIDVDKGQPYKIPEDNPFINKPGRDEIWSYGLRNPWRFSFDPKTGDLYIADVGQYKWEEINFQPSDSKGGQNYGWRYMEGLNTFNMDKDVDVSRLTMPVAEYGHDDGCSVTGGYVYRGKKYKNIEGTYFFGDFCSGIIWGLRKKNGQWQYAKLLQTETFISSFGIDNEKEIYLTDFQSGSVFRIISTQ